MTLVLVYIWVDPRDDSPYYVGMGTWHRANDFYRKTKNRETTEDIWASGAAPTVLIHSRHRKREAAAREEMRLIKKLGRRDLGTGCLTNMTAGGEWTKELSLESKAKISFAQKGVPRLYARHPLNKKHRKKISEAMKGRTVTPEHRAAISAAHKDGRIPKIIFTEEVREKIAASKRGRPMTLEAREKIRIARTGMKYPNRVKTSDETRARQSIAQRARFARERDET